MISLGEVVLRKRVLIIDDEDDIREVAQISLETIAGWEVLTADSGNKGIQIAETEQPDAILLDVMMPEMDGPSTLRVLQDSPRTQDIPVIFLTAKLRVHLAEENLRDWGVVGLIGKPFDAVALGDQVSDIIGWA